MVGLMVTSSKKASATGCVSQVCCSQRPCPCSRPLLTRASAGDTQTPKGRSGSVSVGLLGPGAPKVLFVPSKCLIPQSCVSSEIKCHWLPKLNSLQLFSSLARSLDWEICCGP